MKISTKGRYALRLMLDLALNNTGEAVSLKDIARRQDISDKYLEQITVGKWESGKSSPDPTTVAKLAEILDTTADYLLGLFDPTAEGQTEERFFGSYVYSLIPVIVYTA